MAASLNKCMFIGCLGRDPEVKYTQSGQAVANFSIACSDSYKGKDGQRAEKTEWVNVVVWGKPAEFCANYLSKGRLVFVEGRMETRKWQDKSGTDRYTTEINASQVTALDKGENKPPQREVRQDMASMDDSPF